MNCRFDVKDGPFNTLTFYAWRRDMRGDKVGAMAVSGLGSVEKYLPLFEPLTLPSSTRGEGACGEVIFRPSPIGRRERDVAGNFGLPSALRCLTRLAEGLRMA
jgi:hypothetical protein